jgi:hypothetical protein
MQVQTDSVLGVENGMTGGKSTQALEAASPSSESANVSDTLGKEPTRFTGGAKTNRDGSLGPGLEEQGKKTDGPVVTASKAELDSEKSSGNGIPPFESTDTDSKVLSRSFSAPNLAKSSLGIHKSGTEAACLVSRRSASQLRRGTTYPP